MKRQWILWTGLFLLTSILTAQTTQEAVNMMEDPQGVGARAQAMGNSYAGVADDYSALYWNPAGLTQISTSQMSGDFYHLQFNNNANFIGNNTISNETFSRLNSLGFAYKFPTVQGSFVLAFGMNRFKDFDDFLHFQGFNRQSNGITFELEDTEGNLNDYYFDQDLMQAETIFNQGHLTAWSLGGGLAMSPNFSLGATIHFIGGKGEYMFDLFQEDVNNVYTQFPADIESYELHQRIDSRYSGIGMTVGGLFEVTRDLNMGFSIDLPTNIKVMETFSENDAIIFDDGYEDALDYGISEWEYVVKYPAKLTGGVSIDFGQILLTASAEYRDWTQVRFDKSDDYPYPSDYDELLAENTYFKEEFRDVLSWSAGGELRVPGTRLKLRGGYRIVPSPLINADNTLDKTYYSGGFGADLDRKTTLDVSYTRGFWKRYSSDSYTPGGTEESIETDKILAGITIRF